MKDRYIQLTSTSENNGEFEFCIRGNALLFNFFELEDKHMKDANEKMEASAIGIQMIRKKAKSFSYRQYQGFDSLVIRV